MQGSYLIKYAAILLVVLFALHHVYATSHAQSASTNPVTAIAAVTPTEAQPTGQQQLTANLRKSGFTDIKVVPDSFLLSAKDPSGNPVTIFIRRD
jgi:hypothetical protein